MVTFSSVLRIQPTPIRLNGRWRSMARGSKRHKHTETPRTEGRAAWSQARGARLRRARGTTNEVEETSDRSNECHLFPRLRSEERRVGKGCRARWRVDDGERSVER